MALGSKRHINSVLKEYFLDVAGTTNAMSFNDAIRAGLQELGYTGSLMKMLKLWAIDLEGPGDPTEEAMSISVALKKAGQNLVGEDVHDVTEGLKELGEYITFGSILTKFEEEKRKFAFID